MKKLFSLKKNTLSANETPQPTIDVMCPSCKTIQAVSESAISSFCKNCKKIFNVKKAIDLENENTSNTDGSKDYSTESRPISCPACETYQDVPVIAISAFCKKCGHRINLQDYKKSNFFRGDLETKGSLYITSTGEINGNVRAGEAIVEGKFNGKLFCEGSVKLQAGSFFFGELHATNIEVEQGATFVSSSVIKPRNSDTKHIN